MAQPASPLSSPRVQAALYFARKRRRKRWFEGLPTEDPLVAGKLWNDNGTIKTSEG